MAPEATHDDAAERQAKRQADSRFRRAESELKKECNSVGVEYIKYSPTESANETKVRRASIRREIDKINRGDEEAPTENRQKKARFQWHENNLKRACEMEVGGMIQRYGTLKHLKYVPPPPSEKAADTKLRRAKLQRQITKMRRMHEKKRLQLRSRVDLSTLKSCYPSLIRREPQNTLVTSPALGIHPVSSGTGRLIDVTPLLLENCDIGQVLWTTLCCGSKTRRTQRLFRKQLDHEKDSGKKQMLNNRCTSWFCCGIGNGVHFVDGELYENGRQHFVAKKLLEQISISGDDLRKIAHSPEIGGDVDVSGFKRKDRMVINVFLQRCARGRSDFSNRSVSGRHWEISHTGWSVFVDPSSYGHMTRTERKCYCIDIEDIGCIKHGLVDIVEKVEEGAPSADVTPILLEHFGVETKIIDYQGLRSRSEKELGNPRLWDYDITQNNILLAEKAIRDEQESCKSLIAWLKSAIHLNKIASDWRRSRADLCIVNRRPRNEAKSKVLQIGLDIKAFRDYQYIGPSFVREEVLRQMEVAKNKLCSIVNLWDVAKNKIMSDEGESLAASMNSLIDEVTNVGQQEVTCISQAVQDAKRQAECKMKELDSAFWDFYEKEVTAKQSAANREVEKINIYGQDLRDIIVSKSKGIAESLKVTSTVNVRPSRNVDKYCGGIIDPCSRKFQPTCRVNVDDIYQIENGKVELLYREEQEIFQIRSKGGSRLFATQSVYEAAYCGDHHFYVTLEQTSQRCKPKELLSCEVVFNNKDEFVDGHDFPRLDETDELAYIITRFDDGLYKKVRHCWYSSWWHNGLDLFVTIGPLPDNSAYSETDHFVDAGTIEDAYAPLYSESGSKMKIEFSALAFWENSLRNGGVLRHIALTTLSASVDEKLKRVMEMRRKGINNTTLLEMVTPEVDSDVDEDDETWRCDYCSTEFNCYYIKVEHQIQCEYEKCCVKAGNLTNETKNDDDEPGDREYRNFLELFMRREISEQLDPSVASTCRSILADDDQEEREEFHPYAAEEEVDDEETIAAEEQLDRDMSYKDEVELLDQENSLPTEELLDMYNRAHRSLDTAVTKIQAIWRSYQVRNSKLQAETM